ncbi:MAG TPA: D-alanyl-D-alanine carboxypeptidase/D-alanyl-D-alanine-endopeptidase, partial [Candidatus Xenobia bacterium]
MDVARAIEGAVAKNPAMQKAHWGMVVRDGQGRVLYQHNPDDLFTPASNLKLITASTVTHVLGADHRFATRLLADGTVDSHGVLHGDVYLQGTGDPSLTTADLKAAVQHLPFHHVDGKVHVDDSAFDNVHTGAGWEPGDLSQPYGAESDALTLDENVAALTVTRHSIEQPSDDGYLVLHNHTQAGSQTELQAERQLETNDVTVTGTVGPHGGEVPITMHEPALYAGHVLKTLLHATGTVDKAPAQGHIVWEHTSPPLLDLQRHMLKESDNLYAETLFHALAQGQSAQAPGIERQTLHLNRP